MKKDLKQVFIKQLEDVIEQYPTYYKKIKNLKILVKAED